MSQPEPLPTPEPDEEPYAQVDDTDDLQTRLAILIAQGEMLREELTSLKAFVENLDAEARELFSQARYLRHLSATLPRASAARQADR